MVWYFLFAVVLLTSGEPATTFTKPYASAEACSAAGGEFSAATRADDKVKQAGWQCVPVDFDAIDPPLETKRKS